MTTRMREALEQRRGGKPQQCSREEREREHHTGMSPQSRAHGKLHAAKCTPVRSAGNSCCWPWVQLDSADLRHAAPSVASTLGGLMDAAESSLVVPYATSKVSHGYEPLMRPVTQAHAEACMHVRLGKQPRPHHKPLQHAVPVTRMQHTARVHTPLPSAPPCVLGSGACASWRLHACRRPWARRTWRHS